MNIYWFSSHLLSDILCCFYTAGDEKPHTETLLENSSFQPPKWFCVFTPVNWASKEFRWTRAYWILLLPSWELIIEKPLFSKGKQAQLMELLQFSHPYQLPGWMRGRVHYMWNVACITGLIVQLFCSLWTVKAPWTAGGQFIALPVTHKRHYYPAPYDWKRLLLHSQEQYHTVAKRWR